MYFVIKWGAFVIMWCVLPLSEVLLLLCDVLLSLGEVLLAIWGGVLLSLCDVLYKYMRNLFSLASEHMKWCGRVSLMIMQFSQSEHDINPWIGDRNTVKNHTWIGLRLLGIHIYSNTNWSMLASLICSSLRRKAIKFVRIKNYWVFFSKGNFFSCKRTLWPVGDGSLVQTTELVYVVLDKVNHCNCAR